MQPVYKTVGPEKDEQC